MLPIDALVVPGSLTMESPNPKVATYKIGLAGRAAAIFGIPEIVVYEDPQHQQGRQIARVLEYQATAPYLRKHLFPLSDDLAHVGVLPPLNLPLHKLPRWVDTGQTRFGAMAGQRVEIGLDEKADLDVPPDQDAPKPGEQFPVEVTAARADRLVVAPYEAKADEYLTYTVKRAPSLDTALRGKNAVLGTSRHGTPLTKEHLDEGLALVFGTPKRGLTEMMDEPPFPLVNTIPDQRTESVRVEEAILATLGHVQGLL